MTQQQHDAVLSGVDPLMRQYMNVFRIKIRTQNQMLGAAPKDENLYQTYIQSKILDDPDSDVTAEDIADELETVPSGGSDGLEEKGWTGFHRLDDGTVILYDYVVKGFMKEAIYFLRKVGNTRVGKLRAYLKEMTGLVHVYPRRIPVVLPDGAEVGVFERPLRARTPRGERVSLVRSDTVPDGATLEFWVAVMANMTGEMLREVFAFGSLQGLGQWRSGGWGRFAVEEFEKVESRE